MVSLRAALTSFLQMKIKKFHSNAFTDKYLLATNIALSLSLSSVGDLLEQSYERYCKRQNGKTQHWNLIRTRDMGLAGCSVGVICHYWYKLLDKRMPGRSVKVVMKKIVLDQLICSPIYISAFFATLGILEGESAKEICHDLKTKAVRVYMAEWIVWPGAQFVNFYWLPSKYRVFYDNLISLGYDIYTSAIKHEDLEDDDD